MFAFRFCWDLLLLKFDQYNLIPEAKDALTLTHSQYACGARNRRRIDLYETNQSLGYHVMGFRIPVSG